jgi:hypothetical protein
MMVGKLRLPCNTPSLDYLKIGVHPPIDFLLIHGSQRKKKLVLHEQVSECLHASPKEGYHDISSIHQH